MPDAWVDEAPVLAGLAAASVQGTVALGPDRGARLRHLGASPESIEALVPDGCHARANGFDRHAGLVVPAGQRERLEHVCRYALRPPMPGDRVRVAGDGQVVLQLRHRWIAGTTHVVFDPVEFLGRLAVLVPRPRINLILYHGVLAPRAAWWSAVVRRRTSEDGREARLTASATEPAREADTVDVVRRRSRGQCSSRAFPTRLVGTTRSRCSTRVPERRPARHCAGAGRRGTPPHAARFPRLTRRRPDVTIGA